MPTYEYECKSCGYGFETFQNMSDAPLRDCPQCGKELRRLINGGTGVIFKGSGFYVTDKKAGSSKEPGAKKSDDKKPDAKDGKKDPACASCAAASACPAGSGGASSANAGTGQPTAKAAG